MEDKIYDNSKRLMIMFLLLTLLGCKKNISGELIEFDVTANYPIKSLAIEDIAEIEYLVLDISDDDYLFQSFRTMTENFIMCSRRNELLFFSRLTGKPVSKVSRYGQSPEEYIVIGEAVYSEAEDEVFILDYSRSINIYGRDNAFKRKIPCNWDYFPSTLGAMYNYDKDYLLFNITTFTGSMRDSSFIFVSKLDGGVEPIYIPFKEKVNLRTTPGKNESGVTGVFINGYCAVRNGKDFLLTDYSSDTVYRFTPDRQLTPVLVRKPSIQKMEDKILLHSWLETNNYLFFSTDKLAFDWKNLKYFPSEGYLMEKNTGKFFQTNISMKDYKGKDLILGPSVISRTPNPQTGLTILDVLELHEANRENKLSGKLKEVTNSLGDDDEMVFMILKFK
jgi:hypothetical protein